MRKHTISAETVLELRQQGLPLPDVAHRLGISIRTARRATARGRREHPPPFSPDKAAPSRLGRLREIVTRQAACRGTDPETFFPDREQESRAYTHAVTAAKAICARCPVRRECLHLALATPETHGVWGGTSEDERAAGWPAPTHPEGEPAHTESGTTDHDRHPGQ